MEEKLSWFDKYIDPECVPLIIALNQLPGIETFESCCGHLKDTFDIWFKCNNFTSLAIIARTFDRRYSDGKWKIIVETMDSEDFPYKTFCVRLSSKKPFKSWNEMFKSVNHAVGNLYYWSDERFLNHFNGLEDKEREKKRIAKNEDYNKFIKYLETNGISADFEYVKAKIASLYGYCTLAIENEVERVEGHE